MKDDTCPKAFALKHYWNNARQLGERLEPAKIPKRATYRTGNVYCGVSIDILQYGKRIFARIAGHGEFEFIFPNEAK